MSYVPIAMPIDPAHTATVVTSRAIRASHEQDFEQWVTELNRLARAAPGYRAAIRLGQTAGFQHLLFRFDDRAAVEAWHDDAEVRAHVAIADGFSTSLRQIDVGEGVAFELPSDASASKWKRFVTTWLTVFPILLTISLVIRTALKDAPFDVTPVFHPAATRGRPWFSRMSAGEATGGVNPARCCSSPAANAAGVA
jgi:antibiotic biosynthesis monooxygenase (ABM) superfamily enzyme